MINDNSLFFKSLFMDFLCCAISFIILSYLAKTPAVKILAVINISIYIFINHFDLALLSEQIKVPMWVIKVSNTISYLNILLFLLIIAMV